MKHTSIYQNLGNGIEIPDFKGGRLLYMHRTDMKNPSLPPEFSDFYETVQSILSKVRDRHGVCYVTIDEKQVSGNTHRRSGVHCDFNWYDQQGKHGAHKSPARWQSGPTWLSPITDTGGMLLVSNYAACQVWRGNFEGLIGPGGDCSLVDLSGMETEVMPADHVYFLNAYGIHESLKIEGPVNRTLIRINFHPDYVFLP